MIKRIILTIVAVAVCLTAMGLFIFSHRWSDATCVSPEMCVDCGKTRGEPLPHTWRAATCTVPETCIECGLTRGDVQPHNWPDTSCISPTPCTECGTLEGMELTHNWSSKGRLCLDCGLDERPTDIRFVDYLGRSLDARWSHMGIKPWYSIKTRETWEAMVKDEYNLLKEFLDADFENERLGQLAVKYIESIIKTRDALIDFGTDKWIDAYYNNLRHEQNAIIYEVNTIYPISVKSGNVGRLKELLVGGEEVDLINVMTESIRFHNPYNEGYRYKYDAIIENPTENNFSSVTYVIEFYDKEGNVIETKTFVLSPWNAGDKKKFSFYLYEKSWGEQVVRIEWEI